MILWNPAESPVFLIWMRHRSLVSSLNHPLGIAKTSMGQDCILVSLWETAHAVETRCMARSRKPCRWYQRCQDGMTKKIKLLCGDSQPTCTAVSGRDFINEAAWVRGSPLLGGSEVNQALLIFCKCEKSKRGLGTLQAVSH